MIGKKINRLTILANTYIKRPNGDKVLGYTCKCDCGIIKDIGKYIVLNGEAKSCGCFNKERCLRHGMYGTPIYHCWEAIKQRCLNPKCKSFPSYGGRGINLDKKWLTFEGFYEDMGDIPNGKTIDRINNDGNYCKENCKWSTDQEQMNNRRVCKYLTYNGKTQSVSNWARELNINRHRLYSRLRLGWSTERALTT